MGLLHGGVVLLLVLAAAIVTGHVHIRFGFHLPRQKLWVMLLLSTCCLTVGSSVLAFPWAWERMAAALDLTSLATLLAGIAAFGVVAQQSQRPVVYTCVNPSPSGLPGITVLPPNTDHLIRFYIHNCSNITAQDVIVRVVFPPQVRVLAVHTPTPSFVTDDGRGLAVHLESDTSHNPVHPWTSPSFTITVRSGSLPGPHIVVTSTLAKDMAQTRHSFVMVTDLSHLDGLDLRRVAKTRGVPVVRIRERWLSMQVGLVFGLWLVAVLPWVPRVMRWLLLVLRAR